MNQVELVLPTAAYKRSFIEAVAEYQQAGGSDDRSQRYGDLSVSDLEADFDAYVEHEKSHALGKNCRKDMCRRRRSGLSTPANLSAASAFAIG